MPRQVSPVDLHIGEKIKMARTLRGISMEKLADEIGVSYQQIAKYQSGKNGCRGGRLIEIAVALNMPVEFFFEGIGGTPEKRNASTLHTQFFSQPWAKELAEAFIAIKKPAQQHLVAKLAQEIRGGTS